MFAWDRHWFKGSLGVTLVNQPHEADTNLQSFIKHENLGGANILEFRIFYILES